MPTFIAVQCPHCHRDQVVKRGKTARGTQRYLCQNRECTADSFLLDYCNRGWLPVVYLPNADKYNGPVPSPLRVMN